MRTILTWLGRLVVGLVILIAIVVAFIYVRSEQMVNQTYHAPESRSRCPPTRPRLSAATIWRL